jgi:hypothetical protein
LEHPALELEQELELEQVGHSTTQWVAWELKLRLLNNWQWNRSIWNVSGTTGVAGRGIWAEEGRVSSPPLSGTNIAVSGSGTMPMGIRFTGVVTEARESVLIEYSSW